MFPVSAGLTELAQGETVYSVDYAPFCRHIAIATNTGNVHIYDNTSRSAYFVQTIPAQHEAPAIVRWAPVGENLLIASQSGHVNLYRRHLQQNHVSYQQTWSNHGVASVVTSAQFLPVSSIKSDPQVPSYHQDFSFVYGEMNGKLTTVYVDRSTGQWNTKTTENVHILGVSSIAVDSSMDPTKAKIVTGGVDGYIRMSTIEYTGEIASNWLELRVSAHAIVDITMHSDGKTFSCLDRYGAVTIVYSSAAALKSIGAIRGDTNPDSIARQLVWVADRKSVCMVHNDGLLSCIVKRNEQWMSKPIEEVF